MKKTRKINLLALFLLSIAFIQNGAAQKKAHYRILNPGSEPTTVFEKAMLRTDLDSLRFINDRRSITIEGSNLVIELYSAKELLATYGKMISPVNIKNPAIARKVKLKLSPDKLTLRVLPLTEKN